MKKLNILIALLLCACFLCSCAGNATESTPDNANSNIDITVDTESSVNDVSDNSIQQEESSLPEDSSKEPSINDSFSIDKVVWNTDENWFRYITIAVQSPPNFIEGESHSSGLYKHVSENPNKDSWYCVDIKPADFFFDYGCIIDEEYTEKWESILGISEDSKREYVVCYLSDELIMELEKMQYTETWYTWMPHPDEVEERFANAMKIE